MKYEKISVESTFEARDAEGMSVEEFFGGASKLGQEMARKQAAALVEKLVQPTSYTMPLSFEGPLKFDYLLDAWSKMHVDFDTNGSPLWPAITFLKPTLQVELQQNLPRWLEDPEYWKRFADLAASKRKEFDEREARRRLVD